VPFAVVIIITDKAMFVLSNRNDSILMQNSRRSECIHVLFNVNLCSSFSKLIGTQSYFILFCASVSEG
jgi:hypothetical protein